jgi:UDP-N-acetylglucosamine:LPS N-acetylglucosamine transferase
MIGYYVHHRGSGHLHRAMAIAAQLDDEVTILSSAARPSDWVGRWLELPLDTDVPAQDADARGSFHFAPVGSFGLAARMARISEWLESVHPDVVVVDVSVEVASLVRLHGVRVVVIAQPGRRSDAAHSLGYRVADAVIGCWPETVSPLEAERAALHRVEAIGGLSRLAIASARLERSGTIAVLGGRGGRGASALDAVVASARASLPDAGWVVLTNETEAAVAGALRTSAVVFAHCGQNAVAEVAASRVPAVFVPEDRPFDEQAHLARQLAQSDLPVRVVMPGETVDWPTLVRDLSDDSGERWAGWVDGGAAERAARVIERVASLGSVA